MPDLTVLMTVYNGMPYLPEAVESILRQTLQDCRFVIVDDGSTDESAAYLDGLEDPRVMILHQANQGTAVAANHGLEYCRTEFTARMDSDDVAHPTRLGQQLDFLRNNPQVGLVGTQIAPLGTARLGPGLSLPCDHRTIFAAMMKGQHAICHSAIMFRTAILRELGGYWKHGLFDAWDMMLRMGEKARLANLDRVLHSYRVHGGSLNGKRMAGMRSRIAFACELARRRQNGLAPIDYHQFEQMQRGRPAWRRVSDAVDVYTRCQYRLAQADLFGRNRLRGYLRLAWAAACSPYLTQQRIWRVMRRRLTRHRT